LPPPPPHLTAGEHIEDLLGLAESQLTRLETIAVERRPEITAAEADIRARTAEVSLAWLETFPDFGVMGQYNSMWGDEEHRWMAGFEMNLPIWRQRIRAARAEADARLAVAKRKRQAMEDEVRAELRESNGSSKRNTSCTSTKVACCRRRTITCVSRVQASRAGNRASCR
jgi:outer membrane protein TolC